MKILDIFRDKKPEENKESRFNTKPKGSSGTEIFAGYIFEEYLKDIRGEKWADKVDMMRRSDPVVKMCLRALKLPLLSQNWFIEKKEDSEEAELQKVLFEKVIFEDISNSFTKLLAEILTFEDFGYSLFEIVHGVSYDERIGVYNTIKKLAYRSQRTIERFNVDNNGNLLSVYQEAQGDVGRSVNIDARFLVHFAPEMEGDNYEGVSKLRPMYGPWLRKNEFLKLLAAGIEKHAIPFPILKVPELKASSEEYDNAIEALECFTSNQSQYMTYPDGWELKVESVDFKSEKVREVIDKENQEMVNSIMASFLLLGQGSSGGGSHALSQDLSDFFAQSLQAAADHISEVFEKKIMKHILDLNYAGKRLLVSLRCDDLRGKADESFANIMKTLVDGGIVKASDPLEDFVREKYKYPKVEEGEIPREKPQGFAFAEKKSSKTQAPKLIRELSQELKDFFKVSILVMSGDFIESLEKNIEASKTTVGATAKMDDPATTNHKKIVDYLISRSAVKAKQGMAKEMGVKLSEKIFLSDARINKAIDDLLLVGDKLQVDPSNRNLRKEAKRLEGEITYLTELEMAKLDLTNSERQKLKARAYVLVDTQAADVYKNLNLMAQSNDRLETSALIFEASKSAQKMANGPLVNVGPDILASTVINNTRLDFAEMEDELEVESFTFIAEVDDVTSDICLALDGKVFAANDPDLEQYYPPLHHNCRSVLSPNMSGSKVKVTGLGNLSAKAKDSITLSESCCDRSDANKFKTLFKSN